GCSRPSQAGPTSASRCRTRRGGRRSPRCSGQPRSSRRSPTGGSSSFPPPPREGAIRFFEGAGTRGALELVAAEILELARGGTPLDLIGVVCPTLDSWRAPLETVFGAYGVPYALEARPRLTRVPFGGALLALLRFAWLGGGRDDLYSFLRSPYSAIGRHAVDFAEGRLRGRAVTAPERVEEETERLRQGSVPALKALRSEADPVEGVRELAASMLRAAHEPGDPAAAEAVRDDLRAYEATVRLLDELEGWQRLAGAVSREELVSALEHATVRGAAAGEAGRVTVLDLLRARTRRLDVLFVLGLEEGGLPRRERESPFLDEDARRRLGARLQRPDAVARDRYLFYTACTRPTRRLYLVREAATDE